MVGKRLVKRLTAREVETLTRPGRHADGDGLYLVVRPGGSKQWMFLYRREGRLREMGLGSPSAGITLAKARQLAVAARSHTFNGRDPLEARKEAAGESAKIPEFGSYALGLLDRIERGFSNPKHRQQWRNTLTTYCGPIWNKPLDAVDTRGVLACLTPIWQSKPETASRLRGRIERVLNAAKAEKFRAGENPAMWRGHLDATLPKALKLTRGHHAALPYHDVKTFVAELRTRDAITAMALEFLILTATRTGEALNAIGEARRKVANELHSGVAIAASDMPAGNKLGLRVGRNPKPGVARVHLNVLHAGDVLLLRADKTPDFIDLEALGRKIVKDAILIPGSSLASVGGQLHDRSFGEASLDSRNKFRSYQAAARCRPRVL